MRKRTLYTYVCQTCGNVRTCYRQEQTTTPCYACAVDSLRKSMSDLHDKVKA